MQVIFIIQTTEMRFHNFSSSPKITITKPIDDFHTFDRQGELLKIIFIFVLSFPPRNFHFSAIPAELHTAKERISNYIFRLSRCSEVELIVLEKHDI